MIWPRKHGLDKVTISECVYTFTTMCSSFATASAYEKAALSMLEIDPTTLVAAFAAFAIAVALWAAVSSRFRVLINRKDVLPPSIKSNRPSSGTSSMDLSVLPCLWNRRSIFPNQYLKNPVTPVDPQIIQSLLAAARWAPFHGKCYEGCKHPARFVVLGKQSMIQMQKMTLAFYDKNWKKLGPWGADCSSQGKCCSPASPQEEEQAYMDWRQRTEDEITGRWGPVSYMIAIIMRRQTSPTSKRLPEWEEAAAVACAVQNMHVQSTKFHHLACYWSSWHSAARDSNEMKEFLGMGMEDKCFGYFIVAQANKTILNTKDRRRRDHSIMATEWRP